MDLGRFGSTGRNALRACDLKVSREGRMIRVFIGLFGQAAFGICHG